MLVVREAGKERVVKVWMYCLSCDEVIFDDEYRLSGNTYHSCRNQAPKTGKPVKLVALTKARAQAEIERGEEDIITLKRKLRSIRKAVLEKR